MIYEKFEPKKYAKARMKNARLGAALVREAPKPQRPLFFLMSSLPSCNSPPPNAPRVGARQRQVMRVCFAMGGVEYEDFRLFLFHVFLMFSFSEVHRGSTKFSSFWIIP